LALGVSEVWLMGYDVPSSAVSSADRIDTTAAEPDPARPISATLTDREAEHLRRYRYIDEEGRKWVDATLDREYDRCAAEKGNASSA